MADVFDPVTLEVIRNRLDGIAAEVQSTLLRSAYSVILKEGEDCSAGLFDSRGQIIAQSTALPQHMGAFIPAMRRLLQAFPAADAREGDVYVMNDPHDGGTHLPDVIVARPVLCDGVTVGFAVCLAHQEDIGGKVPGSMPTDSTEIFQEGLILPPLALYLAGELNLTLTAIIERNVRLPRLVLGDLSAQVAAVAVGARRLGELFAEYGRANAERYLAHLIDYAETLTRRRIEEIPDGVYRFTDYMDNDGIRLDARVPIAVTVTVRGSNVRVDFTGTAAQVAGPINAPWSGGAGSAYFALRCVTDPAIPNNQGCYRPIEVVIPEGTLLNPRHPAPVAIRAHTLKRAADAVLGALVQAVPERVPAAPAGSISCVSFGGVDPGSGERFGLTDIVAGGGGARPMGDGIEVVDTDVSNCMNIPVEAIEMGYPMRVRSIRLRRDGGGAGRERGGTGIERVLEVTRGEIACSYRSERHFTAPWGLFGGRPGSMWRTDVVRADGAVEPVPSKRAFTLHKGDALRMLTGGGGGYGSPLERDPARVRDDVRDGKVSAEAARAEYGVVLDDRGEVDAPASDAERERARRHFTRPDVIFDRGFDDTAGGLRLAGAVAEYGARRS
jgi:N-methylhydantoinase B